MKPNVVSQTEVRLIKYLKSNRSHPGLIVAGTSTENKLELAKNMAKFLLCPNSNETYCNTCNTCRRVEKEIHPDVLLIKPNDDGAIKIDEVREACHQMEISPLEGDYKVCIIDECHEMNAAAANAFLKSLEEPKPGRSFWLLTSQLGSLLPTIISRCLTFYCKPEEDSFSLSDKDRKAFNDMVEEYQKDHNPHSLVSKLSEREEALNFVLFLQEKYRDDVVSLKTDGPYHALTAFDALLEIESRMRTNANFGLVLEGFLRQGSLL